MIASAAIFIVACAFAASGRIEKSVAAIVGTVAVLALRLITFGQAAASIDLNAVFLFVGMSVSVKILAGTGIFEWIAIRTARKFQGNIVYTAAALLTVTMILSAFLGNITAVVLIAPLTILIAQLVGIPVVPLLILQAVSANIGGTATLVGNPANIIIASQGSMGFLDFLLHLAPVAAVLGIAIVAAGVLMIGNHPVVSESIRIRVLELRPELAIRDPRSLRRSLFVLALMFLGFFFHSALRLEPGLIALGGTTLLLLVSGKMNGSVLKTLEWDFIVFLTGFFIITGALRETGVVDLLAGVLMELSGGNTVTAMIVILLSGALFSAFLDTVPFAVAMAAVVQKAAQSSGAPIDGPHPFLIALTLGLCLGGNLTLFGASANAVAADLGTRNGYPVPFGRFLPYGIAFTIPALAFAAIYLIFRYA